MTLDELAMALHVAESERDDLRQRVEQLEAIINGKEPVRVVRLIEYIGTREWVEHSLNNRGVKGTRIVTGGCMIREAILGEFPEVMKVDGLK